MSSSIKAFVNEHVAAVEAYAKDGVVTLQKTKGIYVAVPVSEAASLQNPTQTSAARWLLHCLVTDNALVTAVREKTLRQQKKIFDAIVRQFGGGKSLPPPDSETARHGNIASFPCRYDLFSVQALAWFFEAAELQRNGDPEAFALLFEVANALQMADEKVLWRDAEKRKKPAPAALSPKMAPMPGTHQTGKGPKRLGPGIWPTKTASRALTKRQSAPAMSSIVLSGRQEST